MYTHLQFVAPLVGAWIEIPVSAIPSAAATVAPLVGAWIEIQLPRPWFIGLNRRSPCGSVD